MANLKDIINKHKSNQRIVADKGMTRIHKHVLGTTAKVDVPLTDSSDRKKLKENRSTTRKDTVKRLVVHQTGDSVKSAIRPVIYTVDTAKKLFFNISKHRRFRILGGAEINNIMELYDELLVMDDDVFRYHVTPSKNDFARWVDTVLGEPALAEEMRRFRSKDAMIKVVGDFIENSGHIGRSAKRFLDPDFSFIELQKEQKKERNSVHEKRSDDDDVTHDAAMHRTLVSMIEKLHVRLESIEKKLDSHLDHVSGFMESEKRKNEWLREELRNIEKLEAALEKKSRNIMDLEKDIAKKQNEIKLKQIRLRRSR